jgi:hypothetical protein
VFGDRKDAVFLDMSFVSWCETYNDHI